MIELFAAAAAFCTLASSDAVQFPFESTARRSGVVSAEGARVIRVEAHAGTLRIEGRPGLRDVRATGTAIASSCDVLDDIKLVVTRVGDTILVRSNIPEMPSWGWNRHAALDMVLELPNTIALEVGGSGGALAIKTVGKLTVKDGSGDVMIEDVNGPLRISDGAGDLHIRNVRGDVRVEDAAGGLYLRDVQGSVAIDQDGEGDLETSDIAGTVHIGYKSAGSIHVADVGGDLLIDRRGSGRLEYCNIKGAVRLPERRAANRTAERAARRVTSRRAASHEPVRPPDRG